MKYHSIKLYKIVILILLVLICWLMHENYDLAKNMMSVTANTYKESDTKEMEKYGYSDMLALLSKDRNIKIINIGRIEEGADKIKVDVEYKGDMDSLYSSLQNFKHEDNFCYIDNIKISMDEDNKRIINLSLYFVKNK